MADQPKHRNTREALIQAGINEINEYGVANLSMRRIAKACGVSPERPTSIFPTGNDFIAAIIEAVNLQCGIPSSNCWRPTPGTAPSRSWR